MSEKQASASFPVYLMMTLSGGSMDAYSYLCRDHVFANGQTGNIVLFGISLAEGNWSMGMRYLWPIAAFACGVLLAGWIRRRMQSRALHWRQVVVLSEVLLFAAVCWIPVGEGMNILANDLISFACGMQLEAFRTVEGHAIATTMCVGNLRSAMSHLGNYMAYKEKDSLQKAKIYILIILVFMLGAITEGFFIRLWGRMALHFSVALLLIAFGMMLPKSEKRRRQ